MTKNTKVGALFMFLAMLAFTSDMRAASLLSGVSAEEYAVFNAVVGSWADENYQVLTIGKPPKLLLICERTLANRYSMLQNDKRNLAYISNLDEVLDDYIYKNSSSSELKRAFSLAIEYKFVQKNDVEKMPIWSEDKWNAFYRKYPEDTRFISFSRVGFDPKINRAIVYVEHWCGFRCGSGNYYWLMKDAKGWKVDSSMSAWVS